VLAWRAVRTASRAIALLGVLAAAAPASAAPYEAFIEVDDQADLEDLRVAGVISQDSYDELLALLEGGVDLSLADRAQLYSLPNLTYDDVDRILAYRERMKGDLRDPAALVASGILSAEELRAITPFLAPPAPRPGAAPGARGKIFARSRLAVRDSLLPPGEVRARLALSTNVRVGGAAVFHRLELGAPIYDPNRRALLADRHGYGGSIPKAYLMYETASAAAVAGSFRAGFGQRLVFDSSGRAAPNGLYFDDEVTYTPDLEIECREIAGELLEAPCQGAAAGRRMTPDFRVREGLLGGGAGLRRQPLGEGWVQAYAWASWAPRSLRQDELVDRARCPDPHDAADPGCAPPAVFVRPEGASRILMPTAAFANEVLPDVLVERLAGVNFAYFADARQTLGLTAYGADVAGLVDGIDLDTQETSRLPTGRRYGALGANFALGKGRLDLAGEAALSIDRMPDGPGAPQGGGGPAAILRATVAERRQELEASLRYYGIDYANPYARPLSQGDELEGQRVRDEAGARVRYARAGERLGVRALVDAWVPPSSLGADSPLGRAQPKLEGAVRADVRAGGGLALGLALRYQDADLRAGGRAQCFEDEAELRAVTGAVTGAGTAAPCSGTRLTSVASARIGGRRAASLTALVEHRLLDDGADETSPFRDRYRQDVAGWLIGLWSPDDMLRLRGRVRYLHQAVNGDRDDLYERSIAALADAAIGFGERAVLRARADVKVWLDDRAETRARSPSPELQLWLSYEARL